MRRLVFTAIVLVCSLAIESHGQGTFQVSFDGPPIIPPGNSGIAISYSEAGISFSTMPASVGFVRNNAGNAGYPDDGSAYIQQTAAPFAPVILTRIDNSLFGLVSVDLAEYSTVFPVPLTVQFVGYYANGSTVTTSFTTDGIIDGTGPLQDFQTFLFPYKEWSGLKRVEIPTSGWSLDNLVVSVPEPATCLIALGGAMVLGRGRLRRGR